MDATIALLDGGGGGGSPNSSTKESAVSKVEKDYMGCMASEVSSYQDEEEEAELELGLGLSLGGSGGTGKGGGNTSSAWGECGRILTAKDFPSSQRLKTRASIAVSGTKRAADSAPHVGGSPPSASQVVGWPPIRQCRMNSLVNQAKAQRSEDQKEVGEKDKSKEASKKKNIGGEKTDATAKDKGHLGLVKVNMDGVGIGRKVDLTAHTSYEALAQTIENMFFKPSKTINLIGGENESSKKISRLLDGSSDFVLTYEDKEGDLMLVGDVPWGMFLGTVRRLRIMKTSEANGLAPAVQEINQRPGGKPI